MTKYKKIWGEKNKDKRKEKSKEYRQANKDKINQRHNQYYEANKERWNEIITCLCGCVVTKMNLKEHQGTKKHVNMMKDDMEKLDKLKCECGFYSSKGHLKRHQKSKYHIDIINK